MSIDLSGITPLTPQSGDVAFGNRGGTATRLNLGAAAGKEVGTGTGQVAAGDHTHSAATTDDPGFMSAADKTKLDGIEAGADVNPAFASVAEIRAGTVTDKVVSPDALADAMADVTLTDAATIALDVSTGFNFVVTLGGNRDLGAPSGMANIVGRTGMLSVIQDATGNRTLGFNVAIKQIKNRDCATALGAAANAVTNYAYRVKPGPYLLLVPIGEEE